MSLEQLQEDIKNASYHSFYVFYGDEPYLRDFYRNQLLDALLPEGRDVDYHFFTSETVSVDALADVVDLFPLGLCKVIHLQDVPLSSPVIPFLREFLPQCGDDTVFLLEYDSLAPDFRSKEWKALEKAAEQRLLSVEISHPSPDVLVRWICKQFRLLNRTISPDTARYMTEICDHDMAFLLNEIRKVASYCTDTVEKADLDFLCIKSVQAVAYELNDLILDRKADEAFLYLENLKLLRTPYPLLFGSLFSCFAALYAVKALENENDATVASVTGLSAGRIRAVRRQVSRLSLSSLSDLLSFCSELDLKMKQTNTDEEQAFLLLMERALRL